jgi:hypothetical protein
MVDQDVEELRARLSKMTDEEFWRSGKAGKYMSVGRSGGGIQRSRRLAASVNARQVMEKIPPVN